MTVARALCAVALLGAATLLLAAGPARAGQAPPEPVQTLSPFPVLTPDPQAFRVPDPVDVPADVLPDLSVLAVPRPSAALLATATALCLLAGALAFTVGRRLL